MSQFKAEVVRVEIYPHPNADRLEICRVHGWQCVSAKGQFKTGDLAVYLPVESVLPENLVKTLGIEKNYRRKLRTIKLRGELSQGVVMTLPSDPAVGTLEEGKNLTEYLGITKWEEPIPVHMEGMLRSEPEGFQKYTDIENIKNFPNVFEEGTPIIIGEKLHGSNLRMANIGGELHVGSHRRNLQYDPKNLYWRAAEKLNIKEWLKPGEQIFAEVVGPGVQDLHYGIKSGDIGVFVFDFMRDGRYVDFEELSALSKERGFPLVPVVPNIQNGSLEHAWGEHILAVADGYSLIDTTQIREGVVVRPVKETCSEKLRGRLIIKCISDSYLLRKDGTEGH